MSEVPRVVWVLGSGFSVPLGGPMLNDLLSLKNLRVLEASCKDLILGNTNRMTATVHAVYALYHYGRGFPEGGVSARGRSVEFGENIWQTAEDFVDYLDVAGGDRNAYLRLEGIWRLYRELSGLSELPALPQSKELRSTARRLVAAECGLLDQPGVVETERWGPYRRWADLVLRQKSGTTIITFNYDRVIETVAPRVWVVTKQYPARWAIPEAPAVLKLHGSVDWRLVPGRATQKLADRSVVLPFEQGRENEALLCPDEEICIATPGPTKTKATEAEGPFGPLWALAEQALWQAQVVVFVGYRFPPSDAHARKTLLEAIADNEKPHLDVHIVLGPERNADVVRLEHMLRYVLERAKRVNIEEGVGSDEKSYRVTWHPLWAQDFLSIYDPDTLSRPPYS